MKIKDFLKTLNRMVKEHPEYNDLEAVYAVDDEGNDYHKVYMTGAIAKFKNLKEDSLEVDKSENNKNDGAHEPTAPNAIIIN